LDAPPAVTPQPTLPETPLAETTTIALAFLVLSAALVAVTVTVVVLETVGAVNKPALETVPSVDVQLTAVLDVPCTVATNCCVSPDDTDTELGDTATVTLAAGETETDAVAAFVGSATLVAVILTVVFAVTTGAVNSPLLEILPAVHVQVTAVSLRP
jgi:hypothetical protein